MSRKEKMKIYHGIPKSVTDNNTIFYADLDGSPKTNLGNINATKMEYKPSPTGYGSVIYSPKIIPLNCATDTLTTDYWLIPPTSISSSTGLVYFVKNTGNYNSLGLYITSGGVLSVSLYDSTLNFNTSTVRNVYPGFISEFGGKPVHLRMTINPNEIKVYLNGKLIFSEVLNKTGTISFEGVLVGAYRTSTTGAITVGGIITLSDVHISNIDRGDYFPTLPQDFIEGKAIIKERLGQQQIKGDPLITQETSVIVPAYVGNKQSLYQISPDGSGNLISNPEVVNVNSASTWGVSSNFQIQALNNELISGVFDSDTVLCKVLNTIAPYTIVVDSVSGLSVGDTFKMTNKNMSLDPNVRTISSIDPATNTIVCSVNKVENGWSGYLLETTASSSSPVVKTTEGTTVNGTWTGLGTRQATFTLGSNTGLTGKDLVVTYSLNIPQGNSHFPELPSEIERAYTETGVEMKPVSEIAIQDDYNGKIANSDTECPHKYAWFYQSTLVTLNSKNQEGTSASLQNYYNKLSKLDGNIESLSTSTSGFIPQMVFSFNLIRLVEDKLGTTIPGNKIEWLKNNLSSIYFNANAYATSPSGNIIGCKVYFTDSSSWSVGTSTGSSSITNISNPNTTYDVISRIIDSNGMVSFLLYANASNGTTSSSVYVDYANVEIKLKMDSTFTTLYCDNKRAREDKCNPVLIQKETKTVKRYLPSKECFVTESNYFAPKFTVGDSSIIRPNSTTLISEKGNSLLTQGTGSNYSGNAKLKGCIARLKPNEPSYKYTGEVLLNNSSFSTNTISNRILHYQGDGTSFEDNLTECLVDTSKYVANNMLLTRSKLVNVNGEVKLAMYMGDIINKKYTGESVKIFTLPNRPLIK